MVPRLGPVHASLWGLREGQGLRIGVPGYPEKVDSQQRPLSQTGPETVDPPHSGTLRTGQGAYPYGQRAQRPGGPSLSVP